MSCPDMERLYVNFCTSRAFIVNDISTQEDFCPGFRSLHEISWFAGFTGLLHFRQAFPSMKDTTCAENNFNTNVFLLIALDLQI